jgi:asparagine synthase (glutamine-hydrolysing)
MCGICGIINFNEKPVEENKLLSMMKAMKHRGPDDEGTYIDDTIGFGFVRLSIIDLSVNGHQPMIDASGQYIIILNGEIYNYIELRQELTSKGYHFRSNSDTEVLLYSYIEWGEECLDKLNGMFAFAILNRKEKTVYVVRDRFGIKPLYYFYDEDSFIFSSEIPPVLKVYNKKNTPDYQAIYDFLVYNRTDQSESTFFRNVLKLPHGFYIKIKDKTIIKKKWYELREKLTRPAILPEQYFEILNSSIQLRLRSDVPVGVCLSGGIDSSSITSVLLRQFQLKGINTFSAVYGIGEKGDETTFINEYAGDLNNMFFTHPTAESLFKDQSILIKAHAEPFPSSAIYAQFKVMELAQGKVKVLLDGQGADEQLAGYHYFFGYYFKELFEQYRWLKLISEVKYYLQNHKSVYGLKSFAYLYLPFGIGTNYKEKNCAINSIFKNQIGTSSENVNSLINSKSLNDALINHFEFKLEHILKWEDRNSMWFSIESRVPFLDFRLVEATLSQHSDLIINKGNTKALLRDAVKNTVPEKIRKRKDKIGFQTPEDKWFRNNFYKEFIIDLLNSSSFKSRNIINHNYALTLYNKHLDNKINISKDIWKWINLELWFQEFIDN